MLKITDNHITPIIFQNVPLGDIYYHNDDLYIKINASQGFNLRNKMICTYDSKEALDPVIPADGELIING